MTTDGLAKWRSAILILSLILTLSGCGEMPDDSRLEEFARDSLATQSEQNLAMAQQSQQIAEAAQQLVAAEAQARQEVIELQRDVIERDTQSRASFQQMEQDFQHSVQQERQQLDAQRDHLEQERRRVAAARHREPLIANAITSTGLLLACLLPLALAAYALFIVSQSTADDAAVGELLVHDLTSEHSVFLPPTDTALRLGAGPPATDLPRLPGGTADPSD